MKNKYLSLEVIEQALLDTKAFFPVNHKWIAEDGTKCSAWNMGNGIWTGDGGYEMFQKEMLKVVKDLEM
jgi:hypothetical protein